MAITIKSSITEVKPSKFPLLASEKDTDNVFLFLSEHTAILLEETTGEGFVGTTYTYDPTCEGMHSIRYEVTDPEWWTIFKPGQSITLTQE